MATTPAPKRRTAPSGTATSATVRPDRCVRHVGPRQECEQRRGLEVLRHRRSSGWHVARAGVAGPLAGAPMVCSRPRLRASYYLCRHPAWPDPLHIWPSTAEHAEKTYNEHPHPDAYVMRVWEKGPREIVHPARSQHEDATSQTGSEVAP